MLWETLAAFGGQRETGCQPILVRMGTRPKNPAGGLPAYVAPMFIHADLAEAVDALLTQKQSGPAEARAQATLQFYRKSYRELVAMAPACVFRMAARIAVPAAVATVVVILVASA